MRVSRRRDVLGLSAHVTLTFGVALLGGAATAKGFPEWYPSLHKPDWTPAAWVFGPVWTVLYALIASSGWLAWRKGTARVGPILFLSQLALNLAWPWLFFTEHRLALALGVAATLWFLIAATIAAFWRSSRTAALLLVPYLAWVGFAVVLTHAVWALNRV